jgi:hypothetical protein
MFSSEATNGWMIGLVDNDRFMIELRENAPSGCGLLLRSLGVTACLQGA